VLNPQRRTVACGAFDIPPISEDLVTIGRRHDVLKEA